MLDRKRSKRGERCWQICTSVGLKDADIFAQVLTWKTLTDLHKCWLGRHWDTNRFAQVLAWKALTNLHKCWLEKKKTKPSSSPCSVQDLNLGPLDLQFSALAKQPETAVKTCSICIGHDRCQTKFWYQCHGDGQQKHWCSSANGWSFEGKFPSLQACKITVAMVGKVVPSFIFSEEKKRRKKNISSKPIELYIQFKKKKLKKRIWVLWPPWI